MAIVGRIERNKSFGSIALVKTATWRSNHFLTQQTTTVRFFWQSTSIMDLLLALGLCISLVRLWCFKVA